MSVARLDKCRLCLRLAGPGRYCSLFERDETVSLADMATALADVQVAEGDGLPERVCDACVETLSTAYLFKLQCERADAQLRKYAEIKLSSPIPLSYSGLLHQDLHVHSQLDCSNDRENIDNDKNAEKSSEPASDNEFDKKSIKCGYCHELYNSRNDHDCTETTSSEQTDQQTSDSDETVVAGQCEQTAPNSEPIYSEIRKTKKCSVSCLLCDEKYNSYEVFVKHVEQCTADVKLHYFVCSACHEVTMDKLSYLQHVKERHFLDKNQVMSIDDVDAPITSKQQGKSSMQREIGWSTEDLYASVETRNKESGFPHKVKSFLGLHGTE